MYYSIKNLRTRYRISSEMKDLKSRVIDISERYKRYQPIYGNQGAGSTSTIANLDIDSRASSILIEEAKLVGIDKPKFELISQILDKKPGLKIVAVVGMGGLGKTTLVRKVYDDAAVKKQFQIHAWLTISQTFDITEVIKNLIQQIFDEINEPVPTQLANLMDFLRLSEFVKGFLQDRRYILVLDDIWSVGSWRALENVLPGDGRVKLTTRVADLAKAACLGSHNYIHWMKPLSAEESWTLFCNKTFQSNHCPPHLEQVSARILKKCEGLPLAIAAVGGLLALKDKDNMGEWDMILDSLGGELEDCDKRDQIKRILGLSFDVLPDYLKSCFLYLSVYPEDHLIIVDDLLEKWIAQGFIQAREGLSSFDVATRYVHQLVNRSLLQVAQTYADGTITHCRLHDVLREMIATKSSELNFTSITRGNCNGQRCNKIRRLAIHDFIDNPHRDELNYCFKGLWSLEFFGHNGQISEQMVSKMLSGGSNLLKVLDLHGAPLEDIPKKVFSLFHLKYLKLQDTRIQVIPKCIGKLKNLEFLDLYGTQVREVPREISKLTKLRSLCIGKHTDYPETLTHGSFKSPVGIGKLVSLESLHSIDADNEKIVREIGKLTKLRRLTITKVRREDGKELLNSLMKLTNLVELSVFSITEDETLDLQYPMSPTHRFLRWVYMKGQIERIPEWTMSLHSLTKLILQDSGLRKDDETGGIGSLQHLPNLVELILVSAYAGEALLFRAGGFQKLKELYLGRLNRLKWVRAEDGSLPSLQLLMVLDCKQVKELPLSIQNLRRLKSLQLRNMCDEFVEKVVNLGKQSVEYEAIACIPDFRMSYWKNGGWNSYLA